MFYTGLDPRDMSPVYVPRDPHEKAMQRALMQYFRPENHALVLEALRRAGREDLIGFGRECLIPPRPSAGGKGEKGAVPRPAGAAGRRARLEEVASQGRARKAAGRNRRAAKRQAGTPLRAQPQKRKAARPKPSPTGKRRG